MFSLTFVSACSTRYISSRIEVIEIFSFVVSTVSFVLFKVLKTLWSQSTCWRPIIWPLLFYNYDACDVVLRKKTFSTRVAVKWILFYTNLCNNKLIAIPNFLILNINFNINHLQSTKVKGYRLLHVRIISLIWIMNAHWERVS